MLRRLHVNGRRAHSKSVERLVCITFGRMVQRLTYRRRHSYATKSNKVRKVKTPGGNTSSLLLSLYSHLGTDSSRTSLELRSCIEATLDMLCGWVDKLMGARAHSWCIISSAPFIVKAYPAKQDISWSAGVNGRV